MRQMRIKKYLGTLSDKVKVLDYGEELTHEQKADYLLKGVLLIHCSPFSPSEKDAEERRWTEIQGLEVLKKSCI